MSGPSAGAETASLMCWSPAGEAGRPLSGEEARGRSEDFPGVRRRESPGAVCDNLVSLAKARLTDFVGPPLGPNRLRELEVSLRVALDLP